MRRGEINAELRRVPFMLRSDVGEPRSGVAFGPQYLRVSKPGWVWRLPTGNVVEYGEGGYAYEFSRDEIDTAGRVYVRVTVPWCVEVTLSVNVERATNTDDPGVYFEIAAPESAQVDRFMLAGATGGDLDRIAQVCGIARGANDDDTTIRKRIRRFARNLRAGTLESLRIALEESGMVDRVLAIGQGGDWFTVDVVVTPSGTMDDEGIRAFICGQLPAGVGLNLEVRR